MEKKRLFTVTLVRHGETLCNRNKIMQGQMDTQLSDIGDAQARLVGKRLKNDCFTHAFSSDLARAANTARHILEENTKTTCELILDMRLRERCFGYLEGRPINDYVQAQEESGVSSHLFTPKGGETIDQVSHRARDFFRDLCKLMAEPLALKPGCSEGKDVASSTVDSGSAAPHGGIGSQTSLLKKVHSGALTDASNLIDLSSQTLLSIDSPSSSTTAAAHLSRASSSTSTMSTAVARDLWEEGGNVLVVSHGLLLHELKRVILGKFKGALEGPLALEAHNKSPNTGVTQVTMAVNYKHSKLKSQCVEVHAINSITHLGNSSVDNLFAHALFQGAL